MRENVDDLWQMRFKPIADSGRLRMVDGDTEISDSIGCRLTTGHTVGHQSVVISAGSKKALYLGDLAVLAENLENPEWGPNWAWSRTADIASRQIIVNWAVENGAILVLGHDLRHPWIRLQKERAGFTVVPAN